MIVNLPSVCRPAHPHVQGLPGHVTDFCTLPTTSNDEPVLSLLLDKCHTERARLLLIWLTHELVASTDLVNCAARLIIRLVRLETLENAIVCSFSSSKGSTVQLFIRHT